MSERAETAVTLINRALSDHQRQASHLTERASAPRLGLEVHDARTALRQATVTRVVSITELFCVDRLIGVAESAVMPEKSTVRRAVFDDAVKGATGSWSSIRSAFLATGTDSSLTGSH